MKLIVGLGNPGLTYQKTRHNVGFRVIDLIIGDNIKYKTKGKSKYYIDSINNLIFLKPGTYMNLSGPEILIFANYYKIKLEDIMIIHDDKDIAFNTIKLKNSGSSGGHNGVKSIIEAFKNDEFLRIKIGILNSDIRDTADFVLDNFTNSEQKLIDQELFLKIKDIILDFSKYDAKYLMNKYNGN